MIGRAMLRWSGRTYIAVARDSAIFSQTSAGLPSFATTLSRRAAAEGRGARPGVVVAAYSTAPPFGLTTWPVQKLASGDTK